MAIDRLMTDKMGLTKILILFFGLMAICISVSAWQSKAMAADRYVATTGTDAPSSGSSGTPYQTIGYAYSQANAGDIIKVKAGNYTVGSSSAGFLTTKNDITYVSVDGKYQARIVPADASKSFDIWENRGNNVVIDGFQIDGTNTYARNGLVNQGSYVTIKNNEVHHIMGTVGGVDTACDGSGGSGINIHDYSLPTFMTGTVVTANKVHNIGHGTCGFIQSIYISTRATVTNNVVYDNPGGAGIHLWHDAHDVKIVNNTVDNHKFGIVVGATNGWDGDDTNNGYKNCTVDSWGCSANNIYVSNNIITGSYYGIDLSGTVGSSNTYDYNLIDGATYKWWPTTMTRGSNNIEDQDPLFVNYSGNDFKLTSTSPAIDEGNSTNAPSVDFDGNTRTGTRDIGAYEYGSSGGSGSRTLTFWEKDSISGTTSGYWYKQALIDGAVVWESDVTADGTGWNSHSIPFTPTGSSINLQFRLISKVGVSNYPVAYYVDDVAISGLTVTNGTLESTTGWTYAESNASFTDGALDTAIFHGGANSYKLAYPGGVASGTNFNSTLSQTVTASTSRTLTFWEKDSEAGTTSGYWYKQALIDGVVVWESDVTADGTGWNSHSITFTPAGSGFTLQFRLISKVGVSNYPISYYIDDVAISGLTVTSGTLESTTGWAYAESNGSFTDGALDATVFHGGAKSYKLAYPGGVASGTNYNSTLSQSF